MTNAVTPALIDALTARLPGELFGPPDPRHLAEPRGLWQGRAAIVARPRTVAEVSAILALCNDAGVGVVPWGGGTGLVGGQTAPDGPLPLLLSLERMTAVRAVDAEGGTLVIEAGATLAAAQAAAQAAGRLFPLAIASEGTATVGGILATNAGGANVLRWGNARDLCLGVEAVLADGTVVHGLRRLRKDNTGYDLRNLLVGSEGTLGVITAAVLRMVPMPPGRSTALIAVADPAAALALFRLAEQRLPGLISAFELIGGAGWRFLAETLPDLRCPLDPAPEWSVLVELGLPSGLDPDEAMAELYAEADDLGIAGDAVMATSDSQRAALWHLREAIPEANRKIGAVSSHDVSLPVAGLPAFIARADAVVAALGPFRVNCFGHLGDGNLHYNVFPPQGGDRHDHAHQRDALKEAVHDLVHAMEGSVSAEHGIGRFKVKDVIRYGDPGRVAAMRAIKAALDPRGILNPGAVLAVE